MEFKDHFSIQAREYARSRPQYPTGLFKWLSSLVENHEQAWDVATGNGQAAVALSPHFHQIIATDASQEQIKHAFHKPNIHYKIAAAEKSGIKENSIDLITVAQALHWFNFSQFYQEVHRVAKKNAIIAAWAYQLVNINEQLDLIIRHFYENTVGSYWPLERKYIDQSYRTIPFPFPVVEAPRFQMEKSWTLDQLVNYLLTWSAVQNYIRKNRQNPVDLIIDKLDRTWGDGPQEKKAFWPIILKVGVIKK